MVSQVQPRPLSPCPFSSSGFHLQHCQNTVCWSSVTMFGSQAQRTEDMWQKAATSLVSSVTELSYSSIFRHFQFFSIIDKAKSVVSPQEVPRASLKYTAHSNQSHTFGNSQVKVAQSFLTLRPHESFSEY